MNEEYLVGMGHQLMPTMSLLRVHTARRSYRLNQLVNVADSAHVEEVT